MLGPALEEKGETQVYEVPRADLNILVAGIPLESGMGLISRFEFSPDEKKYHLLGRLVLLDGEIPRELGILSKHHWKVTGLSHLLLGESPAVKCLQFRALGPSFELAGGIEELLTVMGRPAWSPTPGPTEVPNPEFQKQAESLLGPGQWKGRVYCLRMEGSPNLQNPSAQENDPAVSGSLFLQQTAEGALTVGDLVLPTEWAIGLFQTLSANHLELTSFVRDPDARDGPLCRVMFWGKGSLEDLAPALKAVRDQCRASILHP
jgi:hypothetical protein